MQVHDLDLSPVMRVVAGSPREAKRVHAERVLGLKQPPTRHTWIQPCARRCSGVPRDDLTLQEPGDSASPVTRADRLRPVCMALGVRGQSLRRAAGRAPGRALAVCRNPRPAGGPQPHQTRALRPTHTPGSVLRLRSPLTPGTSRPPLSSFKQNLRTRCAASCPAGTRRSLSFHPNYRFPGRARVKATSSGLTLARYFLDLLSFWCRHACR